VSGVVRVNRRLWLTADRAKLVEDGSPKAAFLWAGEGEERSEEEAERLGYKPKVSSRSSSSRSKDKPENVPADGGQGSDENLPADGGQGSDENLPADGGQGSDENLPADQAGESEGPGDAGDGDPAADVNEPQGSDGGGDRG
jgi:hypothetical protein